MGRASRLSVAIFAGLAAVAGQLAPGQTMAASHAKARMLSFSDSYQVPTTAELKTDLGYFSHGCGKATSGSVSFSTALKHARALVGKAGAAAVKKVETGPDANPQRAEVDAAGAMAKGNPVGALAALLSAYDHDKTSATHLRNIGAVLADVGMPKEALAVLAKADTIKKSKAQSPMGIDELDSEANNRAYAMMELGRFSQAVPELRSAIKQEPGLVEAKTNLGIADVCLGKPALGASMVAAGARRNTFTKTDTDGTPPDALTQAPVGQYLDLSHGHAGSLPYLDYPKSVKEMEGDGSSYFLTAGMGSVVKHFHDLMTADSTRESALMTNAHLEKMPPAERMRIDDLEAASQNAAMGGYKSLQDAAWKTQDVSDQDLITVFSGQCGLACQKWSSIVKADPSGSWCAAWWPQMSPWITSQTQKWAADMQAEDSAWRKEWAAQSKWATSIIANISNRNVNQALTLLQDTNKQSDMYLLTSDIGAWEQAVWAYDPVMRGLCSGTPATGPKAPADTKTTSDDCPKSIKDHGFSFSVGILSLATDCETISVTVSDDLLGPFARVTVAQGGNVTITMGAQAGVSMGPDVGGGRSRSVCDGRPQRFHRRRGRGQRQHFRQRGHGPDDGRPGAVHRKLRRQLVAGGKLHPIVPGASRSAPCDKSSSVGLLQASPGMVAGPRILSPCKLEP